VTTGEAILPLLDHLCNEARNAMHSAFGLMEFQPEPGSRPTWYACLQASRSSADRLLRTIDDLRELVAGPPAPREAAETFDLTLCAGEVATVLNFAAEGKSPMLIVDPQTQPLQICHSRQAFEQMLARVLKLSLKLTHSANVRISIASAGAPAGDPRVGMRILLPESARAQQLAEWMNAAGGLLPRETAESGLILAAMVAGNRLRALGGSVEFSGEGLAMYFDRQTISTEEKRDETQPSPLQVLVVEDCDESFALTALQLQSESVDRAQTGVEAVEKVRGRRFDLVFMDVHMPGIDGYETIRQIRDWETESGNARTPIVVLSSDDLVTQTGRAAQAGCSGFLRKPVRTYEIHQIIAQLRSPVNSAYQN
jgi:CheY-like chemotaxis protein